MKLSDRVKPISHLKAHAPDVIRELAEGGSPYIVTVNGEAKAVLQDIGSYEQTQETLALLKILAIGNKSLEASKAKPLARAFADIRRKVADIQS